MATYDLSDWLPPQPKVYRQEITASDSGANYDLAANAMNTTESKGTIGSVVITNPSDDDPLYLTAHVFSNTKVIQASDAETVSIKRNLYFDDGGGSLTLISSARSVRYQNHTTSPTTKTNSLFSDSYGGYPITVPAGGTITLRLQHGLLYDTAADETAASGNSGYASGNGVECRTNISLFGITSTGGTTDL